jgi:hypothetical protein
VFIARGIMFRSNFLNYDVSAIPHLLNRAARRLEEVAKGLSGIERERVVDLRRRVCSLGEEWEGRVVVGMMMMNEGFGKRERVLGVLGEGEIGGRIFEVCEGIEGLYSN